MKSTEFITEEYNDKIKSILHQAGEANNIEHDTMAKIIEIANNANLEKTIIETLLKIGQECKFYLKEAGLEAFSLYRGLESSISTVDKNIRLQGRETQAMSMDLKQYVNEFFTEYYGAPFRDSLFCTGDLQETDNFGYPYVIFPKGNFKYLWSPEVKDMNYKFNAWLHRFKKDIDPNNTSQVFINNVLSPTEYKTTDLPSAIKSKNEIMIRGTGYYGIKLKFIDSTEQKTAIIKIIKLAG